MTTAKSVCDGAQACDAAPPARTRWRSPRRSELVSTINIDQEKTLNPEEQVFLQKILNKIEKLELKILPKANLLNSFSKSII